MSAEAGRLPRVSVLGLRGVPATWGGVERQCEELYTRLAADGFPVTIYGRAAYVPAGLDLYRGIRCVRLPAPAGKHLEASLHTLLASLHLVTRHCDIVHIYSQGPALFAPLIRLVKPGCRIFFTCGGLDWQRRKWSFPASLAIRAGEWCSAHCTDRRIMVSRTLGQYYHAHYGVDSLFIPNGVTLPAPRPLRGVPELGLSPRGYAVFVGRLVPEKRLEDLIAAFAAARPGLPLVIVGGAAGSEAYVASLRQAAAGNAGIVFAGFRHGEELDALFANAGLYVTASELEGLPLSLLEAMAYGLPCLASDIAPHREALGDAGVYFPVHEPARLGQLLVTTLAAGADALASQGAACRKRAAREFSWDTAADRLARAYVAAWTGNP